MRKIILISLIITLIAPLSFAQKFMTKSGVIRFSSDTPMEKIDGTNNQVNSALDLTSGNFVFRVLIRGFEFPKALMQEHFNENYMESTKFPNATFTGKVVNAPDVKVGNDGIYKVNVEGDLTIHGVTKKVKVNGTIELKNGKAIARAAFPVVPGDYNITIPKAVAGNFAEAMQVEVNVSMDKL